MTLHKILNESQVFLQNVLHCPRGYAILRAESNPDRQTLYAPAGPTA